MSDWQYLAPHGAPQPGSPVTGGGGRTLAGYRDILDAKRSAATARTPDAEYPSGYLGTIKSRREDRLLGAVQTRLTSRQYQRGVHKGEKIDSGDYFWPDEFNPMSGLAAEAVGAKWTAVGSSPAEQINHLGKGHMLSPAELGKVYEQYNVRDVQPADDLRRQQMQTLLPSWR